MRLSPQLPVLAGATGTPSSIALRTTLLKGENHMTALPDLRTPELLGQPRSRYQIDYGGAQLHVHARSLATVLRIDGEIDASNADVLTQAIRRFSQLKAPLILDLSSLEFLGSAGLEALLVLNDEHQQDQMHCTVVSGVALRRLTQVVPDHGLPTVDSLTQALQHIEDVIRARRRLVSGLARQQEPQRNATMRVGGLPA